MKLWNTKTHSLKMATGKIRPRKPHFFKPILPNSFEEISIPIAFFRYLAGEKCEEGEAVLRNRRRRKSWRVKINGLRFQEGWKDFARDHALRLGDLVVFRHEGGLLFDVVVFGANTCEIEYYHPFDVEKQRRGKEVVMKDVKSILEARGVLICSQGQKAATTEATFLKFRPPYFVVSVKSYNLKNSCMPIPRDFSRSNCLTGKRCKILLKDQKGRSWTVRLKHKKSYYQAYLGAGWHEFSVANGLKEGDVCAFELICMGKMPVMEFHLL